VFLVTQQHWNQSEVGVVTAVSGLLRLAVQTPIGAAIDETRAKRGAIVLALAALASAPERVFGGGIASRAAPIAAGPRR
jgi:hypothetical protein